MTRLAPEIKAAEAIGLPLSIFREWVGCGRLPKPLPDCDLYDLKALDVAAAFFPPPGSGARAKRRAALSSRELPRPRPRSRAASGSRTIMHGAAARALLASRDRPNSTSAMRPRFGIGERLTRRAFGRLSLAIGLRPNSPSSAIEAPKITRGTLPRLKLFLGICRSLRSKIRGSRGISSIGVTR